MQYVAKLLNPSLAGGMYYICDTHTGQYLMRPAEDGGFVRFEKPELAESYAKGLNAGKGWPREYTWGGGGAQKEVVHHIYDKATR